MNPVGEEQYIVTPAQYTFGGEALARLPDGRAVFVPFAMVGEQVRIAITEAHGDYTRARLVEVLRSSPERLAPRCKHFTLCGGCQYQHLPYETQLQVKQGILIEQLARLGGLDDLHVEAIFPSPEVYQYRNHVQFHLTPEGRPGFYRHASQEPFEVEECHLAAPALEQARQALEFEPGVKLSRIGLRLGDEEDIQIILEGEVDDLPEVTLEGLPFSIVYLNQNGVQVMAGSPYLFISLGGRTFRVSAASFFQVNTAAAELMVFHLMDQLERRGALSAQTTLLEAYCGVGLMSAFLAPRVGRLIGIEINPEAGDDFAYNLDEFEHIALYIAPVESVLRHWREKVDVLLLDPPRSGVSKAVLQALAQQKVPLVAYLSCNPATLGRDARFLHRAGYRLTHLALFDFFPQTYSIECLSLWEMGASHAAP